MIVSLIPELLLSVASCSLITSQSSLLTSLPCQIQLTYRRCRRHATNHIWLFVVYQIEPTKWYVGGQKKTDAHRRRDRLRSEAFWARYIKVKVVLKGRLLTYKTERLRKPLLPLLPPLLLLLLLLSLLLPLLFPLSPPMSSLLLLPLLLGISGSQSQNPPFPSGPGIT